MSIIYVIRIPKSSLMVPHYNTLVHPKLPNHTNYFNKNHCYTITSFSITGVVMYASLNVTSVPQLLPPLIHNEDPLRYNAGPYIELDIVLQTEMVLYSRH